MSLNNEALYFVRVQLLIDNHKIIKLIMEVTGKHIMLEHHNILVPLDGSENSHRALHAAQLLAKETPGSRLHLVYVATEYQLKNQDEINRITEIIGQRAKETMEMGVEHVRFEILEGDAREVIAFTYPEEHDCDLIVIAATGRGKLNRMLMGSVANYVLHYAKQDTILIR
ncbi:hypothetical protein DIS14_11085 [Leuconostoc pseudomesenteroides]|nr:hypothetical protein DIS14_11085 [Leuconostoc pseudomesenteroides]